MKTLFMYLINALNQYGKLLEANLYSGGNYSIITAEFEGNTYTVSISKKETEGEQR